MSGYSGRVAPGGPAQRRDLPGLTVRKLSVGPMDNNAYLLTCTVTGEQLLVDAAAEAERLLALVAEDTAATGLGTVVTTHRHRDHHGALAEVVAATGAQVAAGSADADHLPVHVDRRLGHGDVVTVGRAGLEVIALRGHTAGSIALAYREDEPAATPGAPATGPGSVHLFTGDSLFPGGPGKTSDPEAFRSLMTDLEERVFGVLDDRTWVYPGHGDDTTLAAERPHLPQWWARGW